MNNIAPRPFLAATAQQLADAGIAPVLARIFAARGIRDMAQLDTSLQRLLPFTQLKNVQHMARILADAVAAQRKLLIVADYDADGATACAVAVRGLRMFGARAWISSCPTALNMAMA